MQQNEEQELAVLRDAIDALDYQIHDLINERAKLALQVYEIKVKYHGVHTEFHRPERERAIVEQIRAHNHGPLDADTVAKIFEKIILSCRELQIQTHLAGKQDD